MKALKIITAEYFQQATGRTPIEDDLERCNCDQAGTMGHESCGWNYRKNVPAFMNRHDDPAYLVTCTNNGTGAVFSGDNAKQKAESYCEQQNKRDTLNTYRVEDY